MSEAVMSVLGLDNGEVRLRFEMGSLWSDADLTKAQVKRLIEALEKHIE